MKIMIALKTMGFILAEIPIEINKTGGDKETPSRSCKLHYFMIIGKDKNLLIPLNGGLTLFPKMLVSHILREYHSGLIVIIGHY